jgi:hypothetical protein
VPAGPEDCTRTTRSSAAPPQSSESRITPRASSCNLKNSAIFNCSSWTRLSRCRHSPGRSSTYTQHTLTWAPARFWCSSLPGPGPRQADYYSYGRGLPAVHALPTRMRTRGGRPVQARGRPELPVTPHWQWEWERAIPIPLVQRRSASNEQRHGRPKEIPLASLRTPRPSSSTTQAQVAVAAHSSESSQTALPLP